MNKSIKRHVRGISFLHAKKAALINFTGSSYHWGCYGTSIEIYHTLLEKGYYVEIVDVSNIHRISPTVAEVGDFDDPKFFNDFSKLNVGLLTTLRQSDLVVVNGEGTLHRLNKGPLNLLYLMYICKKYLSKKVHLINFSCFPNGDDTISTGISKIYPNVIKHLDKVTPRDHVTSRILLGSGIKTLQAFDCLPRFLDRYKFLNSHEPAGYILISGGVNFNESRYELLVEFIKYFLQKNIPVKFLSGAQFSPANEDLKLQKRLAGNISTPGFSIIQAKSMDEWLDAFVHASFLFSARFHHTIAALSIGTPFIALSSNTPKIKSIIETLQEDPSKFCIESNDYDYVIKSAVNSLDNTSSNKSISRVDKMLSLGAKNFEGIL